MTVMHNEDPALPETTEGEAWYDAEIAPALADLAKRCNERGMSFMAVVEYQSGDRGGTYMLTEDAGLSMQMLQLCSRTAPNVDAYIMNLKRHCKAVGQDISGSFVLRAAAQTQALQDVIAERRRQIEWEGWGTDHDDTHTTEELAFAAACYATADWSDAPPAVWPWNRASWKPKDRRRNMVRAAALLLAEIERLDRAGEQQNG